MKPAVFLDKDGTLINDVPYNVDPALISLAPGVQEGTKRLYEAGYELIVVTNQSGVARGYFPESAIAAVEQKLRSLLKVPLTGFYYCPHHPEGRIPEYSRACKCRKPNPGLLIEASKKHNLDLPRSWMVGDILNDIEAGNRAGCRSLLVDCGNETEWDLSSMRIPYCRLSNFQQAVNHILYSYEPRNQEQFPFSIAV